jgi:NAD(P)-dependent dehydrogenase (short-subunit alcohol dehydrogenase family)
VQAGGKIALVTGAARRVGKAIALALADRGAHVVITYNTSGDEALATLCRRISPAGATWTPWCDRCSNALAASISW